MTFQKIILTPEIERIINLYHQSTGDPLSKDELEKILIQMNGIKQYAHETFGAYLPENMSLLNDEEIGMLSLSIWAPHPTPEKSIVAEQNAYMEVRRALSRFFNLHLLLQGESGYELFVANQEENNIYLPRLTLDSYRTLCKQFLEGSELSIACLRIATLIGSVPLSNRSKVKAKAILGENNYVIDSVEFPASVFEKIDNAKIIYPIVQFLFSQHPESSHAEITRLFQSMFPHHTHYRHMLYTEGNQNMFYHLVENYKNQLLTKEDYLQWVKYWTLNITGFRGNVEPVGSIYLTENTYKGMHALESVLEKMFDNVILTPADLLNDYLSIRAEFLELNQTQMDGAPLDISEQKMLAHIGAMLRFYHPREGSLLAAGYSICKETVQKLAAYYFVSESFVPTPTYAPALFTNAIDFRAKQYGEDSVLNKLAHHPDKQSIHEAQMLKIMLAKADAIIACLPIYLEALRQYYNKLENNEMSPNQPLSFQKIAGAQEITEMLGKSPIVEQFNILDHFAINVELSGSVTHRSYSMAEKLDKANPLVETKESSPSKTLLAQYELSQSQRKSEEVENKPKSSKKRKIALHS